tara:strand:- start:416 stop:685 length:270 start_codon:yes stop_codon:yes gene_type:complete
MTKSEVQAIREDLDSLKSNVVKLTETLGQEKESRIDHLKEVTLENVDALKAQGAERYAQIRTAVKEQPAKSVGIAFAAGLLASFLLTRK